MKRLLTLGALFGGLLLFPGLSFSADGDRCVDTDGNEVPLASRGKWAPIACIQLCDGKAAADSACTEWDFNNPPGMPDMLII